MSEVLFGLGLSGLQDFIFNVPEENAAKRLRARSALLTILPGIVWGRLQEFGASKDGLFYLGGAQLLARLPAVAFESIKDELSNANDWLTECSEGRLVLYWAKDEAQGSVSDQISQVARALSQSKMRSGRSEEKWVALSQLLKPAGASGGELGDPHWEADTGGELAREADRLKGFKTVASGGWRLGPWRIQPVYTGEAEIPIQRRAGDPRAALSLPLYIPMDAHTPMDFSKIAESGEGAAYLGVLKLDGDGVGNAIRGALEKDSSGEAYRKISESLRTFFAVTVPELLQKHFPNTYLVYSGGDDLLAVGHFWEMAQTAGKIQSAYADLKVGTMSAGLIAAHPKTPLRTCAELADAALEVAKTTKNVKGEVKNRIFAFGRMIGWSGFGKALDETGMLTQEVSKDSNPVPRGTLQLIVNLGAMYERYLRPVMPDDAFGRKALPLLHYFKSRRELKEDNLSEQAQEYLKNLLGGNNPTWYRAPLAATLAGWLTKKRRED